MQTISSTNDKIKEKDNIAYLQKEGRINILSIQHRHQTTEDKIKVYLHLVMMEDKRETYDLTWPYFCAIKGSTNFDLSSSEYTEISDFLEKIKEYKSVKTVRHKPIIVR